MTFNKGKFTYGHDRLVAIPIFSSITNTEISILGHGGLCKQAKNYLQSFQKLVRTILQLHNTQHLSIWEQLKQGTSTQISKRPGQIRSGMRAAYITAPMM